MINYHLHLPKKMGVKLLYPRRRGLIFKMLAFCTFIGFIGLWFKNDDPGADAEDFNLRKDHKEGPNHIPVLDESKPEKPVAQLVQPDEQIIHVNDKEPVPVREIRLPPPQLPQAQNLQPQKQHIPSKEEVMEKMKADRWFAEDEMKIVRGMGEGGKVVRLVGEEGRVAEEVMKKEAFNLIASDKISLNRTVPDSRDPL